MVRVRHRLFGVNQKAVILLLFCMTGLISSVFLVFGRPDLNSLQADERPPTIETLGGKSTPTTPAVTEALQAISEDGGTTTFRRSLRPPVDNGTPSSAQSNPPATTQSNNSSSQSVPENTISVQQGYAKIGIDLVDANQVEPVQSEGEVAYPDILSATDLIFTPQRHSLDITIALKDDAAPSALDLSLKLPNGYRVVKDKLGGIAVLNNLTQIFYITTPSAADMDGSSVNYSYSVIQAVNDVTILSLRPAETNGTGLIPVYPVAIKTAVNWDSASTNNVPQNDPLYEILKSTSPDNIKYFHVSGGSAWCLWTGTNWSCSTSGFANPEDAANALSTLMCQVNLGRCD